MNDEVIKVSPVCPHFGSCGGCTYQDFDYTYELNTKEKVFRNAFSSLELSEKTFSPIQYGRSYGYRSRMDFLFHNYKLCQRLKGNFRVKVALSECHIANPTINYFLKRINLWFKENQTTLSFLKSPDNFNYRSLKYVTIRKPSFTPVGSITFILNQESSESTLFEKYLSENISSFLELITDSGNYPTPHVLIGYVNRKQEISVSSKYRVLVGESTLEEILKNKRFLFHTQGFFQNNSFMIEKIISTIENYIEEYNLSNKADIYDLYGGCGVFGASLASKFKNVWVVDTEGLNINLAETNFHNNGLKNIKLLMCNVKDFLDWEEYTQGMKNSVVVLDPPRSGLGNKVVKKLLKRSPPIIFYISCKYSVLVKEIEQLQSSYEIKQLIPFDFFPRTPHLEVLAFLSLKS